MEWTYISLILTIFLFMFKRQETILIATKNSKGHPMQQHIEDKTPVQFYVDGTTGLLLRKVTTDMGMSLSEFCRRAVNIALTHGLNADHRTNYINGG